MGTHKIAIIKVHRSNHDQCYECYAETTYQLLDRSDFIEVNDEDLSFLHRHIHRLNTTDEFYQIIRFPEEQKQHINLILEELKVAIKQYQEDEERRKKKAKEQEQVRKAKAAEKKQKKEALAKLADLPKDKLEQVMKAL